MSQPSADPYNEEVVSIPVAIVAAPGPTVPSTASGVQADRPLGANPMRPAESPALADRRGVVAPGDMCDCLWQDALQEAVSC